MKQTEEGLFVPFQFEEMKDEEVPNVPRSQYASAVVNDLLAIVPALLAIIELYESVKLEEDDEASLSLMFGIVTNSAMSMLSMLELMQREVEIIYAIREGDSESDNSLDQNDSE